MNLTIVNPFLCPLGDVVELWVVEAVLELRDVVEGLAVVGAHEGREAREEDVGDNAHGPHVCGQRDWLVVDDLH